MLQVAFLTILLLSGVSTMAKDGSVRAPKPTGTRTEAQTDEERFEMILKRMDDGDESAWDEFYEDGRAVKSRRDMPLIKPQGFKF
jgi:hypothetical protein